MSKKKRPISKLDAPKLICYYGHSLKLQKRGTSPFKEKRCFMKRILFAVAIPVAAMLGATMTLAAQAPSDETVVVKKSDLTPDQLSKIQQQKAVEDIDQQISRYGKWVGLGKQVGIAVDSSLSAITDQAEHFAKTGVGKVTVALVIWKVLGDQIVHIVGGIVELLVFLPLWIWSYRKFCLPHRVLAEKAQGFFGAKKWATVSALDSMNDEMKAAVPIVHWVAGGVLMIVVLLTVFSY
jgi:hypothetical protein